MLTRRRTSVLLFTVMFVIGNSPAVSGVFFRALGGVNGARVENDSTTTEATLSGGLTKFAWIGTDANVLADFIRTARVAPVLVALLWSYYTTTRTTPSRPKEFFALKVIEYTDRPRKTRLLRLLQRMQRAQGGQVMVRHATLAKSLKCSERTIRRTIDQLVESGHIIKSHAVRPTKGGYLCVYQVRTDVIYRTASPRRRAEWAINRAESDHLRSTRKQAQDAGLKGPRGGERKTYQYKDSNRYRRGAHPSIDRRLSIKDLLGYARIAGISDSQRGYLTLLARRYGVYDAWEALKIALESGQAREPVSYAWGVLRKWYPEQRKEAMA